MLDYVVDNDGATVVGVAFIRLPNILSFDIWHSQADGQIFSKAITKADRCATNLFDAMQVSMCIAVLKNVKSP